jgi:tetratricopeptide (TPR) repeat protein
MMLTSRAGEANAYLARNCPRFRPGLDCRQWQVTLAKASRDKSAVAEAAAAYLAASCENEGGCAAAAMWLGSVFESLGEDAQALKMFERAAHEGELPRAWENVAKLATRLGFVAEAKRARERAGRATVPSNPAPAPSGVDRDRLRQLVDDAEPR